LAKQRYATTSDAEPSQQYIRGLIAALENSDYEVQEQAADDLHALGAAAVPALIAAFVDGFGGGTNTGVSVTAWCINLLGRLHDRRAAPLLVEALSDPSLYPYQVFRRHLICAVERCGAKDVAEPLLRLLDGPDSWIHSSAILALKGARFSRPVRRRVADALAARLNDPEEYVSWCAMYVLGWLGDQRAVAPLGRRLLDYPKDHTTCCRIVEALGRVGGDEAIELLVGALEHPWWPVRAGALEALGRASDLRTIPILEAFQRLNSDDTNYHQRIHFRAAAKAIDEIKKRHVGR
jgi:HEAT repeat protein